MTRAGHESRRVLCVLSPAYFDGNRMVAFESLMARRLDPSGSETALVRWCYVLANCLSGYGACSHRLDRRELSRQRMAKALEGTRRSPRRTGSRCSRVYVEDSWSCRPVQALKIYVYVSDSKVSMLYPQGGRDTVARGDSNGKLDAVLADLVRAGRIGTIDEPKEHFTGAMPMRWGPCAFSRDPPIDSKSVSVFRGADRDYGRRPWRFCHTCGRRDWVRERRAPFVSAVFHIATAEGIGRVLTRRG